MNVTSTIDQLLNPPQPADANTKADNTLLGKEDFLLLLVTQMRHQNPLDPIKNAEFVSQLAQFSSLEQLTTLNKNIEASFNSNLALTQSISNTMAAALIGKRVVADNNTIYHLEGNSELLRINLTGMSNDVIIRVKTFDGKVIYEAKLGALSAGVNDIVWEGLDSSGNKVENGQYYFEVDAKGLDGEDVVGSLQTTGVITAVRYRDGIALLVVNNIEIPLSDVYEILDSFNNTGNDKQNE